ncbi:MAG: glycosyltransferase family 4 protein [Altibacter sp.]|nr:glycosyltransferase family 4 protein [Altibacter sp.]
MKTLLIIGHTFPEPSTTAAGTRMMQLVDLFLKADYTITFASTALRSERAADLDLFGIKSVGIQLNDPSFDRFITPLSPTVVVFDRYITEEQFGWRVAEACPLALRILDTEDLHFLRKARQTAYEEKIAVQQAYLFTETAKRELASILRCDLSLIISEVEISLLQSVFSIPKTLLYYLPFLIDPPSETRIQSLPRFADRKDFMTIGNLLHAPNKEAVKELKHTIWPKIRQRLPQKQIHVYGAYANPELQTFHNEREGFIIHGWAPSVEEVMHKARICLAPLYFGAGLKGKIVDAMQYGLPVVTTAIGAEGIYNEDRSPTNVQDSVDDFVAASVELYTQENKWLEVQQNGFHTIATRFRKEDHSEKFTKRLRLLLQQLKEHRNKHFIGQILQHHSLQSTKYLSKWIEVKNNLTG